MSKRANLVLTLAIVLAALASAFFGLRSYGSFLLLRSAYEVGRPDASSLRGWMTLAHVAATYRVPRGDLLARLDLPPDSSPDETLKSVADQRGVSPFDFVREVQRAIGAGPPLAGSETSTTQGNLGDGLLSAVLAYGYPALAVTLLLGAIGLPVPTGLVTVLAGSLAALGQIEWSAAAAVAILASLAGDAIAFLIGRLLGETFLTAHGRLIGYSPERFEHVRLLFARWGGLTVLFTRTLVSHLSSITSLLAGLSRYPWPAFLLFSGLGRVAWTSAYLGLGFAIGSNIDAASQFLANLSGLLLALAVLMVATIYRTGLLTRASA